MADRHGHGLIDRKAEEVGLGGGRLIIIGGADKGGALHAGGDGGKRKGTVEYETVAPACRPEARTTYDFPLATVRLEMVTEGGGGGSEMEEICDVFTHFWGWKTLISRRIKSRDGEVMGFV